MDRVEILIAGVHAVARGGTWQILGQDLEVVTEAGSIIKGFAGNHNCGRDFLISINRSICGGEHPLLFIVLSVSSASKRPRLAQTSLYCLHKLSYVKGLLNICVGPGFSDFRSIRFQY